MTVTNKSLPHAPRPRPRIERIATTQNNHVNRAKPATIDTPPWEKEKAK